MIIIQLTSLTACCHSGHYLATFCLFLHSPQKCPVHIYSSSLVHKGTKLGRLLALSFILTFLLLHQHPVVSNQTGKLASRIWTTVYVISCILLGSHVMLLLTAQSFSIFDLVRLLMSLICKMMSSLVIYFVQNSRTIPSSFMALQPRMRSYTGLVTISLSFYTTSSVAW
jgi:hypothetical protein